MEYNERNMMEMLSVHTEKIWILALIYEKKKHIKKNPEQKHIFQI